MTDNTPARKPKTYEDQLGGRHDGIVERARAAHEASNAESAARERVRQETHDRLVAEGTLSGPRSFA